MVMDEEQILKRYYELEKKRFQGQLNFTEKMALESELLLLKTKIKLLDARDKARV